MNDPNIQGSSMQAQEDASDADVAAAVGSAHHNVVDAISGAMQQWLGASPPRLSCIGECDATTTVDVVNRYVVKFGQALSHGMGRVDAPRQVHSREELVQHVNLDVAAMSSRLQETIADVTANGAGKLVPMVAAGHILRTGEAAAYCSACNTCGGSAQVSCPTCVGSLRVSCVQCTGGRARCAACAGSGQVSTPCFSCGGTGGSYSAAATWDYQYQQNTWDYQNRQTQSGGQWQACVACGGSRSKTTSCTACQYGQVSCQNCAGRGYNNCNGCGLTGRVACVKCVGGFVHVSYAPQVEVTQSHEVLPLADAGDAQRRVLALTKARIEEFGAARGEPEFSRSGDEVLRRQAWEIPAVIHTLQSDHREYAILSVGRDAHVMDCDGIGDEILEESLSGIERKVVHAAGDWKVATVHRLPIHRKVSTQLATQIGVKSLIPSYRPASGMLDGKVLAATQHIVSRRYVERYVSAVAGQLRRAVLGFHGVGLVAGLLGLLALFVVMRFGLAPAPVVSVRWTGLAVLVPLLLAEVMLWVRLPVARITPALLLRSPPHWLMLLSYALLFVGFHTLVAPHLLPVQ